MVTNFRVCCMRSHNNYIKWAPHKKYIIVQYVLSLLGERIKRNNGYGKKLLYAFIFWPVLHSENQFVPFIVLFPEQASHQHFYSLTEFI